MSTVDNTLHPKFEEVSSGWAGDNGKKKAKVIRYKGKTSEEIKEEREREPDLDPEIDQDELEDEYFALNDEQKKAYRERHERIKQEKIAEFRKRENYQRELKETTLKTFKDKPDLVSTVHCVHAEGSSLVIEWEAPGDNNSPISRYNIYMSTKSLKINHIGV